jgi:hypothetical protein
MGWDWKGERDETVWEKDADFMPGFRPGHGLGNRGKCCRKSFYPEKASV